MPSKSTEEYNQRQRALFDAGWLSWDAIRQGRIADAERIIKAYHDGLPPDRSYPNPLAIASPARTAVDADPPPKILAALSLLQLEIARSLALLNQMWNGKDTGVEAPSALAIGLHMEADAVPRMLLFHESRMSDLAQWRASGVVAAVQIVGVPDENQCRECRKIGGKTFKLDEALELPHEHCRSLLGCRCMYSAVLT